MTDSEKIIYAKSFIDKLANGVNPIDGTAIKEDDIVNNIRISRCLFYVSEVLQRVIDEDATKKVIVEESVTKVEDFVVSPTPLTAAELARRIKKSSANIKVSGSSIGRWLHSIDLIYDVEIVPGKVAKVPTARGKEFGIIVETRHSEHGVNIKYLLDENAQQFVFDNIEAVIECRKNLVENRGKVWTAEDDALLKELYDNRIPIRDMANMLKRSTNGVYMRILTLGIFDPTDIGVENKENS